MNNKTILRIAAIFALCVYCAGVPLRSSGQETGPIDINQTLSDGAQKNTIAFDGLAFMTGGFCDCTFLPPGKVADYCGFQYFRDNDPTGMGHNTDFLTIIAYNVLDMLDTSQIHKLHDLANYQIADINQFAYQRFPMIKAFVRLLENDVPAGSMGLNKDTVMEYSASLYLLDGKIAYYRAKVYGEVLRSLSPAQVQHLDSLVAIPGVANWDNTIADPIGYLHLPHDENVALMTYASEMFSWYAGDVTWDVYFCPERQCTYFGSFYMKDIPAVGNPGYSIDTNMTQAKGDAFLNTLNTSQKSRIIHLVDTNRTDLYDVVDVRTQISTLLRGFLTTDSIDSTAVMNLSMEYGRLDGRMSYQLAKAFAEVGQLLTQTQIDTLFSIRDLDTFVCNGAFVYSSPIATPVVQNTDFFFILPSATGNSDNSDYKINIFPNPFNYTTEISLMLNNGSTTKVEIYNQFGQKVKSLYNGYMAAGTHKLLWNSDGDDGGKMAGGLYFCKLSIGQEEHTIKLIKTE
jgi:hypothetical protein